MSTTCEGIGCDAVINPQGKARGRKRFCSRRCQLAQRSKKPNRRRGLTFTEGKPIVESHLISCLECGSGLLSLTAKVAEHRSAETHQAQVLTCVCGLEMLLSVDLSRIKNPSRSTT